MEKTKFTNLINNLSNIAKKAKWIPRYDKEMDYLFWTKKSLSKKSKLIQVSHEAALYVNPNGVIEGVFIEYLTNNFISHNPAYKDFVKEFTEKTDDNSYTVKDEKKVEKYLLAFGESIRADIYQDAKEIGKDKLDLDNLFKQAFAQ